MVERTAIINGHRLSFLDTGPVGGPAVVVHDGYGSRLVAALVERFADRVGVRLIAPDRPGFWRSDAALGDPFEDWPPLLSGLLDELEIVSDWSALASDVHQPAHIWVGLLDSVHPASLAAALVRCIPQAVTTTVDGGFLDLLDRSEEVLSWCAHG